MRLVVFWLPIVTNALVVPVNNLAGATRLSAATLKRTEAPPRDVSSLTGRKFAVAGAAVAAASIDVTDDATKD